MRVLHILRDFGLTGVPKFIELFTASNYSKTNLENFVFTTDHGFLKERIKKNAILIGYRKKLKYSILPLIKLPYQYFIKKIDVVHIHINPWGILFVYLFRVPAIVTFHVLPKVSGLESKIINLILRHISSRNNIKFIAVSKKISEESAKILSIDKNKINVIYNGVKIHDKFLRNNKNDSTDKCFIIGQVGSLSEAKGQIYTVKSAAILKDKGYNFKIYFAGEGPLRDELEKMGKALNLNSNIFFLGNILFDKFINTYAPDIIVMPSLSEPFGFVIIEAWSYGVSVIASRVQGPMEIITEGKSGLLVEPANAIALADKIEMLILNPVLRKKLISGGIEDVRRFDIEKTVENYFNIYKTVIYK